MVLVIGSEKYNDSEDEEKIIGYCVKCGNKVTKLNVRVVSLGREKELYCEKCFRKHFIQPIVDRRIFRYTNLLKTKHRKFYVV